MDGRWLDGIRPAESQGTTREARALFDQGIAASDAGRYADAATFFERSLRLRPSPVALRNLAVAYRGVGRLLDAIRAFEQYFANPGSHATPEELARLHREYSAIQGEVPELRFDVAPANATIRVDGREPPDRSTALRIDPGRHVVEVSGDDFTPQHLDVVLARSEHRTFSARLQRLPPDGRLAVETNVADARLELDGHLLGMQTAETAAAPGGHSLAVTAGGYRTVRRTVTVGRHGVARVSVVLQRTPGLPLWATVSIIVGSVAVAGVVTAVVVTSAASDSFVPPQPPSAWGEIAFPQ